MFAKKMLAVLLVASSLLGASSVTAFASEAPTAPILEEKISPRWALCMLASCNLNLSSSTATASVTSLAAPGATVAVNLIIQEKKPGGAWRTVITSSGKSTTYYNVVKGNQYRAKATLTFKKGTAQETVIAESSTYTA